VPIAKVASLGTGEQPIDRAPAAVERPLCGAGEDEHLADARFDAQIDGPSRRLPDDRQFLPAGKLQAAVVNGAVRSKGEADVAAQLARGVAAERQGAAGTHADGGDDGELASFILGGGKRERGATVAHPGQHPGNAGTRERLPP
jgi:hypothetical protein